MTGPEHYREAERLIRLATLDDAEPIFEADADKMLAAAQVHATLALAAATAAAIPEDGSETIVKAWYEAGAW